jgi:hypothetical protein
MNLKKKFLLLWVIFVLLDPDTDSESGSVPLNRLNPDPQPCLHVAHNVGLLGGAEGAVAAAVGGALAREAASHLQVPVTRVGQERGQQVCGSIQARSSVRAGREQKATGDKTTAEGAKALICQKFANLKGANCSRPTTDT